MQPAEIKSSTASYHPQHSPGFAETECVLLATEPGNTASLDVPVPQGPVGFLPPSQLECHPCRPGQA